MALLKKESADNRTERLVLLHSINRCLGVVAIVTFSTPAEALLVPMVYFALTALEGNVVTPVLIGRRFALNPIIVVVWFIAWGAMWGLPGLLIATPTLMACKIVCENIPELSRIDRVISR